MNVIAPLRNHYNLEPWRQVLHLPPEFDLDTKSTEPGSPEEANQLSLSRPLRPPRLVPLKIYIFLVKI